MKITTLAIVTLFALGVAACTHKQKEDRFWGSISQEVGKKYK